MDDKNDDKLSETVNCSKISVGVPCRMSDPLNRSGRVDGYQVQDRTLLVNRSSMESNLSYPSREPSLLEELRTSLENKTFMKLKRKPQRNVSLDFTLSSSPGSNNTTLDSHDQSVAPKSRKLTLFSRHKKKDFSINFTLGNESSSSVENEVACDTTMSLSPPGGSKSVFKRPQSRRVSVKFDCDVSVSDDSKTSLNQDSLLDVTSQSPNTNVAKLRSTRSRGLKERKEINEQAIVDFTLSETQDSEMSMKDSISDSLEMCKSPKASNVASLRSTCSKGLKEQKEINEQAIVDFTLSETLNSETSMKDSTSDCIELPKSSSDALVRSTRSKDSKEQKETNGSVMANCTVGETQNSETPVKDSTSDSIELSQSPKASSDKSMKSSGDLKERKEINELPIADFTHSETQNSEISMKDAISDCIEMSKSPKAISDASVRSTHCSRGLKERKEISGSVMANCTLGDSGFRFSQDTITSSKSTMNESLLKTENSLIPMKIKNVVTNESTIPEQSEGINDESCSRTSRPKPFVLKTAARASISNQNGGIWNADTQNTDASVHNVNEGYDGNSLTNKTSNSRLPSVGHCDPTDGEGELEVSREKWLVADSSHVVLDQDKSSLLRQVFDGKTLGGAEPTMTRTDDVPKISNDKVCQPSDDGISFVGTIHHDQSGLPTSSILPQNNNKTQNPSDGNSFMDAKLDESKLYLRKKSVHQKIINVDFTLSDTPPSKSVATDESVLESEKYHNPLKRKSRKGKISVPFSLQSSTLANDTSNFRLMVGDSFAESSEPALPDPSAEEGVLEESRRASTVFPNDMVTASCLPINKSCNNVPELSNDKIGHHSDDGMSIVEIDDLDESGVTADKIQSQQENTGLIPSNDISSMIPQEPKLGLRKKSVHQKTINVDFTLNGTPPSKSVATEESVLESEQYHNPLKRKSRKGKISVPFSLQSSTLANDTSNFRLMVGDSFTESSEPALPDPSAEEGVLEENRRASTVSLNDTVTTSCLPINKSCNNVPELSNDKIGHHSDDGMSIVEIDDLDESGVTADKIQSQQENTGLIPSNDISSMIPQEPKLGLRKKSVHQKTINVDFTLNGTPPSKSVATEESVLESEQYHNPLKRKSRKGKISVPFSLQSSTLANDTSNFRLMVGDSFTESSEPALPDPSAEEGVLEENRRASTVSLNDTVTTSCLPINKSCNNVPELSNDKIGHHSDDGMSIVEIDDLDESGVTADKIQSQQENTGLIPSNDISSMITQEPKPGLRKKSVHQKIINVDFTLSDTPPSKSVATEESVLESEKYHNPLKRKSRKGKVSVPFSLQSSTLANDTSNFRLMVGDSIVQSSEPVLPDPSAEEGVLEENRSASAVSVNDTATANFIDRSCNDDPQLSNNKISQQSDDGISMIGIDDFDQSSITATKTHTQQKNVGLIPSNDISSMNPQESKLGLRQKSVHQNQINVTFTLSETPLSETIATEESTSGPEKYHNPLKRQSRKGRVSIPFSLQSQDTSNFKLVVDDKRESVVESSEPALHDPSDEEDMLKEDQRTSTVPLNDTATASGLPINRSCNDDPELSNDKIGQHSDDGISIVRIDDLDRSGINPPSAETHPQQKNAAVIPTNDITSMIPQEPKLDHRKKSVHQKQINVDFTLTDTPPSGTIATEESTSGPEKYHNPLKERESRKTEVSMPLSMKSSTLNNQTANGDCVVDCPESPLPGPIACEGDLDENRIIPNVPSPSLNDTMPKIGAPISDSPISNPNFLSNDQNRSSVHVNPTLSATLINNQAIALNEPKSLENGNRLKNNAVSEPNNALADATKICGETNSNSRRSFANVFSSESGRKSSVEVNLSLEKNSVDDEQLHLAVSIDDLNRRSPSLNSVDGVSGAQLKNKSVDNRGADDQGETAVDRGATADDVGATADDVALLITNDHEGVLVLAPPPTNSLVLPSTSNDVQNSVHTVPVTLHPTNADDVEVAIQIPLIGDNREAQKISKETRVVDIPLPTSVEDTVNRQTILKLSKSKRKSVSFKPAHQNVYHSPPDYLYNIRNKNSSESASRREGGGYDEFSKIQMTTEISDIQTSVRVTRSKKHYSSTPISKKRVASALKLANDEDNIRREANTNDLLFAKPVSVSALVNNEFLVPPPPLFATKPDPRVSSGGLSPLNPVDPAEPSPKEGRNEATGGGSSSSVDLSIENSLNISAIPKENTGRQWGNLFHSTPLHRTRSSKNKLRKVSAVLRPEDPNVVDDRSVNTTRTLRSRSRRESKISKSASSSQNKEGSLGSNSEDQSVSRRLENNDTSPHRSDGTSPNISDGASPNRSDGASPNRSDGTSPNRSDGASPNRSDGASPNRSDGTSSRISIKDNTVLSSQAISHSRARDFASSKSSRSSHLTRGSSSYQSYDSHRKLISRRLFDNGVPSDDEKENHHGNQKTSASFAGNVASTSQIELINDNDDQASVSSGPSTSSRGQASPASSVASSSSNIAPYIRQPESFKSHLGSLSRSSRASSVADSEACQPRLQTKIDAPKKLMSKFSNQRRKKNLNDGGIIFPKVPKPKTRKRAVEGGNSDEWSRKPRKLFKPGKWASKKLYNWLELKLKQEYGLKATVLAEKFVINLHHSYILASNGHLNEARAELRQHFVELGLATTELEYSYFISKFMPFDVKIKFLPAGGAFGQAIARKTLPYDPL